MAIIITLLFWINVVLASIIIIKGWKLRSKLLTKYPESIERTPFGYIHNSKKLKRYINLIKSDYETSKLLQQIKKLFIICILLPFFMLSIILVFWFLSN